jgi:hypothetical protein
LREFKRVEGIIEYGAREEEEFGVGGIEMS